jgi:hypothetical protein
MTSDRWSDAEQRLTEFESSPNAECGTGPLPGFTVVSWDIRMNTESRSRADWLADLFPK